MVTAGGQEMVTAGGQEMAQMGDARAGGIQLAGLSRVAKKVQPLCNILVPWVIYMKKDAPSLQKLCNISFFY